VKRIFNMAEKRDSEEQSAAATHESESGQEVSESVSSLDLPSQSSPPPPPPTSDATKIMKTWKEFILQYSTVREETPAESAPESAADKNKKPASKKGAPELAPAETKPKAPLYSIDDVRLMTDYLSNSLFQFYDLYEFVFTSGGNQSTVEEQFCHVMQYPITIPPLNVFKDEEVYVDEQNQKELERRQNLEEEHAQEQQRIKQAREEREERERHEREEREAPRLSSEQLAEIASYLKFHLNKDLTSKEQSILERMQDLQGRLEKQEEERPKSGKGKKK